MSSIEDSNPTETMDEATLTDKVRQNSTKLQQERQRMQEKMYVSWFNYRLKQTPGSPQIVNLFEDLKDGKYLLALLSALTKQTLKPPDKGNQRIHHLLNLTKVFNESLTL